MPYLPLISVEVTGGQQEVTITSHIVISNLYIYGPLIFTFNTLGNVMIIYAKIGSLYSLIIAIKSKVLKNAGHNFTLHPF